MARENDFETGPSLVSHGWKKRDEPVAPLSFRDQCAIAAMNGLAAAQFERGERKEDVVQLAFDIADQMDTERQRRGAQ